MSLPIVALTARDAPAIAAHLLRLDAEDRSFRFAAGVVSDATIEAYVARIPFERDALLGVVDAGGRVLALGHGCAYDVAGRLRIEAAFSVDADLRRQGLCRQLLAALERHAESVGAEALIAMCVARNLPMRRIFEQAGMRTTREDGEVHARREFTGASAGA